jgi:hypothetical protein
LVKVGAIELPTILMGVKYKLWKITKPPMRIKHTKTSWEKIAIVFLVHVGKYFIFSIINTSFHETKKIPEGIFDCHNLEISD